MNVHLDLDTPTAIHIAECLERQGKSADADRFWMAVSAASGYDRDVRGQLGDLLFGFRQAGFQPGTVERSRFILSVLRISFPTRTLTDAYFENLERWLQRRQKRTMPGDVVLGMGSGRCGSTTLSAAFARLDDCCATHENPPRINWEPFDEQVQFHLDRLRVLADYFAVVFDAAHSWLRVVQRFFREFPNGKVIGLARETEPCVRSYLKFQGRGSGSSNHWAPPDTGLWSASFWDAAYPSYPVPQGVVAGTEGAYAAKAQMIARYVVEYNQALASLAAADPQRVALVRTESMNDAKTIERLKSFTGHPLTMPEASLNVGTNTDGSQPTFWY